MNKAVMDYLMRKVESERDGRRGRSGRYVRDRRDYDDDDYEMDGRRGVRGSGRGRGRRDRVDYADDRDMVDRRDRRDFADYDDYEDERDYEDRRDRRDYGDYGSEKGLKLTKSELNHWKHKMQNSDGTRGEHYDMQQIVQAADRIGVKFNEYDEKEFCVAVNMMYSDYGHLFKKHVSPEKELIMCAEMAKAFFDDPDGPEPSEKLALYYHCIACNEEV